MHNASFTVDNNTLQSMTHDLMALLEDAKELANRPETLEAVNKITEVRLSYLCLIYECLYLCNPKAVGRSYPRQ